MQQQQRKFARVWFPSHRASSSPNVALNSIVDGVTSELLGNAEVQHAVPLFTALVLSCHMIPGFSHPFGQSSATRDQLAVPGAPNLRSTRQRDSLGPLLFMAGLLPALQSLREEFPPTVTILAYFDDLLVVGRPDDVLAALSGVAEALARVGLDLNKNKCKLLATLANLSIPQRAAFAAHGIPPAADHLEFLGAMIGPPERVAGFLDHKLHTFQAIASTITSARARGLPTHGLYKILRYCAVPSVVHLFRSHQPSITADFADGVRATTLDGLYGLLGVPRDPSTSRADHIAPLALGSLGMPDPTVVRHTAYVACLLQASRVTVPNAADLDPDELAQSLAAFPDFSFALDAIAALAAHHDPAALVAAQVDIATALREGGRGLQRKLGLLALSARSEQLRPRSRTPLSRPSFSVAVAPSPGAPTRCKRTSPNTGFRTPRSRGVPSSASA